MGVTSEYISIGIELLKSFGGGGKERKESISPSKKKKGIPTKTNRNPIETGLIPDLIRTRLERFKKKNSATRLTLVQIQFNKLKPNRI